MAGVQGKCCLYISPEENFSEKVGGDAGVQLTGSSGGAAGKEGQGGVGKFGFNGNSLNVTAG